MYKGGHVHGVSSKLSAFPPGNAAWPGPNDVRLALFFLSAFTCRLASSHWAPEYLEEGRRSGGGGGRGGHHKPEKLLKLAARIVSTTLRSPLRSAYSSIKTAALRLTGSVSHSGNGGGRYARRRAIAAFDLITILDMVGGTLDGTGGGGGGGAGS